MGNVINLNQFRKKKARAERRVQADENAVRHGRSKADKDHDAAQAEKSRDQHEAHKREDE
ncbi:DUF4169 family protein [Roseovarius gahaiensis]|uniref:DUF4169 family protein n=1 Tax=Roseovarius gahaiensis TaxID=2716691 RepID=A0A967B910_9RHOB|nr:DUF4169 family protein [Roseovarius gahaiensis]NHQ73530.1 DUF4169 family protein [Roseovarius gahaiensis]